jgi:hypothetical protein
MTVEVHLSKLGNKVEAKVSLQSVLVERVGDDEVRLEQLRVQGGNQQSGD